MSIAIKINFAIPSTTAIGASVIYVISSFASTNRNRGFISIGWSLSK